MSGICGIYRLDGRDADVGDVDRQLRALSHLGPDGARVLADGGVGLGYAALDVTREDRFDAQPLSDAGGVILVADIRLDNREALAAALQMTGPLNETPDSAFLLAAYRRWGAACAEQLIGDFAFAIWDARRRTLLLARDHMGQRHLFYHRGADLFAFATEIKGLWGLPEVPRALSEIGIARRLLVDAGDEPGGTLFDGIEALPGGTTLTVAADGAVTRRRYWTPHAAEAHLGRDEAYYRQAYRDVLAEAVACRLRRATRPAALLLSGGYDSAAIAALAAPALGGRKLVAVASVLGESNDDETPSARRWVGYCQRDMPHLDVRQMTFEGADILSSAARLSLAMDRPASPNAYALDAVCREAAAAGARVVMDGYGGDYTLNPRGGRPLARLLFSGRLGRFWSEFWAQRRWRRERLWTSFKREVLLPLLPSRLIRARARYRGGLPIRGLVHAVNPTFAEAAMAEGVRPSGRPRPGAAELRAKSLRTLRGAQDSPTLGGLVFAAHGLELTQPFHDKRVVELALAVPEDLYFRDGRPRHLARAALADFYPPEFQAPPPGNIPFIPDYPEMIGRIESQLLAEIDRLEGNPHLARYFDFAKMRRMLARGPRDQRFDEAGPRLRQAARTFLCAHYVDRFRRDNG